jgi:hypothetical protein
MEDKFSFFHKNDQFLPTTFYGYAYSYCSLLKYDGLESWQTSKPQNRRPLNCTSLCTNPLPQLHYILFIVAARFISAIRPYWSITYVSVNSSSAIPPRY